MISKRSKSRCSGRSHNGCRGITLLELVLAVSLLSLVSLGFAAVYGTSQRYLTEAIALNQLQGAATVALRQMTRTIRGATQASWDGATLSLTVPTDPDGPTTVTMTYGLDVPNEQLWWNNGNGPQVVANNVTAFVVTATGSGVEITLTTDRVVNHVHQTFTLRSTVALRGWSG